MFDIGFAELLIIGVVALLVIGPERLPEAVRTASAWINRLRRGFNDIKHEVQQELHNDQVMRDLRESGETLRRESDSLRRELSAPLSDAQDAIKGIADEVASIDAGSAADNPSPGNSSLESSSPADEPNKASDRSRE